MAGTSLDHGVWWISSLFTGAINFPRYSLPVKRIGPQINFRIRHNPLGTVLAFGNRHRRAARSSDRRVARRAVILDAPYGSVRRDPPDLLPGWPAFTPCRLKRMADSSSGPIRTVALPPRPHSTSLWIRWITVRRVCSVPFQTYGPVTFAASASESFTTLTPSTC